MSGMGLVTWADEGTEERRRKRAQFMIYARGLIMDEGGGGGYGRLESELESVMTFQISQFVLKDNVKSSTGSPFFLAIIHLKHTIPG